MSTKRDYTREEWELLLKAPMMAAMAIVAASPVGPIGVLREMYASGKGFLTGAEGTANSLIAAVVADVKTGSWPSMPAERPKDVSAVRAQALGAIRAVAGLLDRKAPGDAEGFKRWLLTTARHAAEAAKELRILGIGGVSLSDAEKAALAEVAGTLGVAPEAAPAPPRQAAG